VGNTKNRSGRSRVGGDEEQRRGQTVGTAMVGGMTLWAQVDKQATGKPRRGEIVGGVRLWAPVVWRSGERQL
jgi:hypothetical protein